MQDRQHHDRVKLSATAAKKRSVLTALPTDSRRSARKVHTEREDVPCSFPVKAIHALDIAVDGHNLRSHLCCEKRIGSGIAANIEDMRGPACSQGTSKDRKSTRLNSSHQIISYAVFCLKKKTNYTRTSHIPD